MCSEISQTQHGELLIKAGVCETVRIIDALEMSKSIQSKSLTNRQIFLADLNLSLEKPNEHKAT